MGRFDGVIRWIQEGLDAHLSTNTWKKSGEELSAMQANVDLFREAIAVLRDYEKNAALKGK